MPQTLFISDLHLSLDQPGITHLFLNFLATQVSQADEVYILGDLFEVWIGDDDHNEFNTKIQNAIKKVAEKTPVFFMHGNRDFLIGEKFLESCGCQLLTDPCVINLYGIPTILTHGDMLCTKDVKHQWWRKFSQSALVRHFYLNLPLSLRRAIARLIRNKSQSRNRMMPIELMDVSQDAVKKLMLRENTLQMIHGHTHQPGIHSFNLNGKEAKRIVLGAWHEQASILACADNGKMNF